MKKQLFSWIVGLMLVISCGFVLVACDQGKTVDGIEIVTPASTLVYEEGSEFSCDGLVIKLKYTDGTYSEEIELSNLTISSPDMESSGTKTISISYTYEGETYTTTYTITVNEHVHLFNLEDASAAHLKSEADCTHKAVYYKSCECGENGVVTFEHGEALGHNIVEHPAVAATCTEMGNVQYWACSRCNTCYNNALGETVIEADDYQIAPTGHTTVHYEADDATCSHEGHSEHWKCSVCQKLYSDSNCETETSLEEVVEKQLNHSFDCSEDLRNKKCSVCDQDVIVLGYDSSFFDPTNYDLTYTVLANDGCIDTYHEKYKIAEKKTLQNGKSAKIYSDTTYTGKYFVGFTGISQHPNSSTPIQVKFFMYEEDDGTLKFQYTPSGTISTIVNKIIDPRRVLYTGGDLHSTYSTQLQNGIILPIDTLSTENVEAFIIKITQFSDTPIQISAETTVVASFQRADYYPFIPLTKTARNFQKPNTWSYNEESYYYTFCNYTNIKIFTTEDGFSQTFDENTGILTSDSPYPYSLQLYSDLTYEPVVDPATFQPSKAIFVGEPWGEIFTFENDGSICEAVFYQDCNRSISYSLEKTYYDRDFWEFDCPEYIIGKISELVGDNTYTKGEGVGEFGFAKIYDKVSGNYNPIESISITKLNDTFSMTYEMEDVSPITLTGTLSSEPDCSPGYDYMATEPGAFPDPYMFFAYICFETEEGQFVYLIIQWLYNPNTQALTPYCILVSID